MDIDDLTLSQSNQNDRISALEKIDTTINNRLNMTANKLSEIDDKLTNIDNTEHSEITSADINEIINNAYENSSIDLTE